MWWLFLSSRSRRVLLFFTTRRRRRYHHPSRRPSDCIPVGGVAFGHRSLPVHLWDANRTDGPLSFFGMWPSDGFDQLIVVAVSSGFSRRLLILSSCPWDSDCLMWEEGSETAWVAAANYASFPCSRVLKQAVVGTRVKITCWKVWMSGLLPMV